MTTSKGSCGTAGKTAVDIGRRHRQPTSKERRIYIIRIGPASAIQKLANPVAVDNKAAHAGSKRRPRAPAQGAGRTRSAARRPGRKSRPEAQAAHAGPVRSVAGAGPGRSRGAHPQLPWTANLQPECAMRKPHVYIVDPVRLYEYDQTSFQTSELFIKLLQRSVMNKVSKFSVGCISVKKPVAHKLDQQESHKALSSNVRLLESAATPHHIKLSCKRNSRPVPT